MGYSERICIFPWTDSLVCKIGHIIFDTFNIETGLGQGTLTTILYDVEKIGTNNKQ